MATVDKKSKFKVIRSGSSDGSCHADETSRAAEFERLYRESYSMVYGRTLFRLRDKEAARDVTSEAFLRAARNFDKFDSSKAKFSTWVCSIANNCIIDYFRRRKEYTPLEDVPESVVAVNDDPSQCVANSDLAQRLLAVLDEQDREIVYMKYCEGWTNGEIASELGMNPSTVSTRVQRSLTKMRAAARSL